MSQKRFPTIRCRVLSPLLCTAFHRDRPKAAQMLSDFLGNDLSRLSKELDKLALILAEKAQNASHRN